MPVRSAPVNCPSRLPLIAIPRGIRPDDDVPHAQDVARTSSQARAFVAALPDARV
jgi:hypothetical protein